MSIGLILCFFLFWINVLIVTNKMLIYADEIEPPIRIENTITSWYLVRVCYMCNPLWHVALSYDVKRKLNEYCRGKKGVRKKVKSSVTRQKGESQKGGNKKQSTSNFLKNENFLTPDTQEGKKCWLFGKFEVLVFCYLRSEICLFALLPTKLSFIELLYHFSFRELQNIALTNYTDVLLLAYLFATGGRWWLKLIQVIHEIYIIQDFDYSTYWYDLCKQVHSIHTAVKN